MLGRCLGYDSFRVTGSCTLGGSYRVRAELLMNLITERMLSAGRMMIATVLRLMLHSRVVLSSLRFPPISAVEPTATMWFTV